MMSKPFSPAADRNKSVILKKLQENIAGRDTALEIGSGTGQHVLYFAEAMPNIVWQPSNLPEQLQQTLAGMADHNLMNVLDPIALDVNHQNWPLEAYDVVYTANTCHIMSWDSVMAMLAGVARTLKPDGLFCIYGPFNYAGKYTSASNRDFHHKIHLADPKQGLRNFEDIEETAGKSGLSLLRDYEMPVNNRFLVFIKH